MRKVLLVLTLIVGLGGLSILPATAAKPVNCGKPKLGSEMLLNAVCKDGSPNLGVRKFLQTESPKIMSFTKQPKAQTFLNAVCADLKSATKAYRSQSNIFAAVYYQATAFDASSEYRDLFFALTIPEKRQEIEINRCQGNVFMGEQSSGLSEAQKIAQELVQKNTQLQDSCYFTRTSNGDNANNARQVCLAKYPNSLQWALSTNHEREESCYFTRTVNGDHPVNARNICLSRFPIRN